MKRSTTRLTAAMTAVLMLLGAGCSNNAPAATTTTAAATTTTTAAATEAATTEASAEGTTPAETTAAPAETTTGTTPGEFPADDREPGSVHVAALKGPTAMGMVSFMNNCEDYGDSVFDFEIYAAPDEITPLLIKGDIDLACIPANLASVLYNKTEGEIEVLAINTLGVLYIVESGSEEVQSIADLKGKTIYASGQGSTPEFALNYLLTQNGIADDVTIEWKSEHAECVSAIAENGGIAMLPQPFVTTAMTKNEGIRVAIDLNDEWAKLDNDSSLITGVLVGRKDFIENDIRSLKEFLMGYKASVEHVTTDTDDAAALIGKYDIVPEAVAKKALPACNITYIDGTEMKEKLSGYLQVLYDSLAQSVGGKLPGEDFYYIGD